MPLPTDFVALLGIDLVLCAACLRLLSYRQGVNRWPKWATTAVFVLLWCPVGAARLPLLAYIRGISSDLSISLVVLACLGMYQRWSGRCAVDRRERMVVALALATAALFLYPFALGWGDWDSYRLGWGSPVMWGTLLALSWVCWSRGLRLLPMLVAAALLAWAAGALESTNLWDYLIDPWLAIAAIFQSLKAGGRTLLTRLVGEGTGATRPAS